MERRAVFHKVNEYTTCIDDAGMSLCYVVCGTQKAAVIDTVNGRENLHDIVREITDLPLVVIDTHGHCDHVFGNVFFEKAYIHEADAALLDRHYDKKLAAKEEDAQKDGMSLEDFYFYRDTRSCPLEYVKGGDTFDLGGVTLEVIEVPGHTRGSIALLDKKSGNLFSGDAINGNLWLQLEESLPLPECAERLKALAPYRPFIKEIHNGHDVAAVSPDMIDYLIACIEDLCENGGEGDESMPWYEGIAKIHRYQDLTSIWYDDKK